ncbi:MAG: hypothetical protein OXF62_07740 [Caldilineaceae bacterium]|nr:hypothetical protein [Caldilineaceae bacterium]
MKNLSALLQENRTLIRQRLFLTNERWQKLICKTTQETKKSNASLGVCKDEAVWTFLIACGYAISGIEGIEKLTTIITGSSMGQPSDAKIWLEAQLYPSRKHEGNTSIDLALGTISLRDGTKGGIELMNCSSSWVCFCEMKWFSDISKETTHDLHRNQLARVIENAIFFNDKAGCSDQSNVRYPDRIYVALVTPKVFRDANVKSRLYQYKFENYRADSTYLLNDLESSALELRDGSAKLAKRLERLSCLCWSTYDDIFAHIPCSAISMELKSFWEKCGNYQGREL